MDNGFLYVDRIEDGYAICEDEDLNQYCLSLNDIKLDLNEGDVILKKDGKFFLDERQKEIRRRKINELQKKVFKNNKKGDKNEL